MIKKYDDKFIKKIDFLLLFCFADRIEKTFK